MSTRPLDAVGSTRRRSRVALAGTAAASMMAIGLVTPPAAEAAVTCTTTTPGLNVVVTCSGSGVATVTVPAGANTAELVVTGAGGAGGYAARPLGARSGSGATVSGTATLPATADTLQVVVGAGGFAYNNVPPTPPGGRGGTGGGGSGVFAYAGSSLLADLIIAGGGGGGGTGNYNFCNPPTGGNAGTLTQPAGDGSGAGCFSVGAGGGTGGTSASGGAAGGGQASGTAGSNYTPGSVSAGGPGAPSTMGGTPTATGGGGGGGYTGGGGGGSASGGGVTAAGGGGGGSSWANPSLVSGLTSNVVTAPGPGFGGSMFNLWASNGADGQVVITFSYVAPKTWVLTYDGNGGTCATASDTAFDGDRIIVPGATDCTRPGYIFTGWNTDQQGAMVAVNPGDPSPAMHSDNTLYAQWQSAPTYTLSYDANGAGTGAVPAAAGPTAAGGVVTISLNSGGLTRPGFAFVGWNTSADGSGTAYAAGDSVTMSNDVVLYAQWTAVKVPVNPPAPVDPPSSPAPGESVVTTGGKEIPSKTGPGTGGNYIEETDKGGTTTLAGLGPNGKLSKLGPRGELQVSEGTKVLVNGTGYKPGAKVAVYILNPSIALCELTADSLGEVSGVCAFPGTLAPGEYVLQVAGPTSAGLVRTVSMPLRATVNPNADITRLTATVYFESLSPGLDGIDTAILHALLKKVPKGAKDVTVQSLGFVQPVGDRGNDISLSTARAANTARYLKSGDLKGTYYVSGRGRAEESGWQARRAEVTVSYRS